MIYAMISFLFLLTFASESIATLHPLRNLDHNNLEQWAPVESWIEDAKIVGLGESAHGVEKYLEAKYELARFLIKNHDFRLIFLEDGYLKGTLVNNYLKSCTEGVEDISLLNQAINSLNKDFFQNIQTKSFFQWICHFNQEHNEDSVSFFGNDIWETPWINKEILSKAAAKIDLPDFNKAFDQASEYCFAWKASSWAEASTFEEWKYLLETWRLMPKRHQYCTGALINMMDILENDQKEEDLFFALIAARTEFTYQNYRDLYRLDLSQALNQRDLTQAWILNQHYQRHLKKSIMLSHNVHVAKKQSVVPAPSLSYARWSNVISTGENLVGLFGDMYKSIAITGYKIANHHQGQLPIPDKSNSLEYVLKDRGELLLVETKSLFMNRHQKWWMHLENFPNGSLLEPKEQYDGILFIKESTAAQLLTPNQEQTTFQSKTFTPSDQASSAEPDPLAFHMGVATPTGLMRFSPDGIPDGASKMLGTPQGHGNGPCRWRQRLQTVGHAAPPERLPHSRRRCQREFRLCISGQDACHW
jgi:erythromycin esterase-like protein